jgi:Protein of unknown function (DUF2510)
MALPAPPYQTADWYPDPEGSGRRRWWNGVAWTTDFQTDATTPTPTAASGPEAMLAEAQAIAASTPGYVARPTLTVQQARRSVTRVVAISLVLGIVAVICAVANLDGLVIFGFFAVIAALFAYGSSVLSARMRFLRTGPNRTLAIVGSVLASFAICLVVATIALGWRVDFSNGTIGSTAQVPNAADNAQTHSNELVILKQVTRAWAGPHTRVGKWPATAGAKNGIIVSSYGSTGIHLPAGWRFTYTPSPDLLGYTATVTDGQGVGEMFNQEQGDYSPTS